MRVRFTRHAERELEDAAQWYLEQQWQLAERLLEEVDRTAAFVADNPRASAEVEPGVRRALVRDFPYALIFAIEHDEIVVLAVAHQRRRPGYWRHRP